MFGFFKNIGYLCGVFFDTLCVRKIHKFLFISCNRKLGTFKSTRVSKKHAFCVGFTCLLIGSPNTSVTD